ncbi:piggyBac transposable element-derived protein 4-like [Osmerus mordax]|uniref:piggyBac transposable element-derived protein 4-like n=1 Tax=Osmerus mordax TaxID=8014 RepID=UPI003510791C
MRQRDDVAFAELLNRIRVKQKTDALSNDDKALLHQAVTDPARCPNDVLHIFSTNKEVDRHNAATVSVLHSNVINIDAEDYRRDPKTGVMKKQRHPLKGQKDNLLDMLQAAEGPEVTVDEQLLAFRGRCPFKQYMPSKPAKYGIKSWVACDAKSSYAWKMQVYTGKQMDGVPERNQGMRVVLDVTEGLKDRNLPSKMLTTKTRRVLSSQFAFTPTTTLVSYLAKKNKNVLLMSTRHTDAEISDRNDGKPTIVLDYNLNKGGVENLDKVITAYSCKRKTPAGPSSSSATSLTSPPTTPL